MLYRIGFTILLLLLGVGVMIVAAEEAGDADYEVWITDQTNDLVLVYAAETWELLHEIDLAWPDHERGTSKPHMVMFSPDQRYAYVANVGSPPLTDNVVVIDAEAYAPVAVLPTGASSHAAMPSTDGSRIWVANIAEHHLTEIVFDAEAVSWQVSRKVPAYGVRPICAWFTADDSAVYVTNGGTADAMGTLAVIDTHSGALLSLVDDFGREACGLLLSQDGIHMYATSGFHAANPPELNDNVFVFDTRDHSIAARAQLVDGQDAHGLYESADGSEIWVVGRATATVEIFDSRSLEHLGTINEVGDRPDLAYFSPDGRYFIVSQRGHAVTGVAHAVSGDTPGFTVIDTASREIVAEIAVDGDVHGLAVRRLGGQ
jgi:DNA-binding beta-propeller fold protein YncE